MLLLPPAPAQSIQLLSVQGAWVGLVLLCPESGTEPSTHTARPGKWFAHVGLRAALQSTQSRSPVTSRTHIRNPGLRFPWRVARSQQVGCQALRMCVCELKGDACLETGGLALVTFPSAS